MSPSRGFSLNVELEKRFPPDSKWNADEREFRLKSWHNCTYISFMFTHESSCNYL